MPHLIIDEKTRAFIKALADESVQMDDIHTAFEAMADGSAKTAATALIEAHSDWLSDYCSDYQGQIAAIKQAVGL